MADAFEHRQAVACCQCSLALCGNVGDRHLEADTLTQLGDIYHATADREAARLAWRRALDVLDELDPLRCVGRSDH